MWGESVKDPDVGVQCEGPRYRDAYVKDPGVGCVCEGPRCGGAYVKDPGDAAVE